MSNRFIFMKNSHNKTHAIRNLLSCFLVLSWRCYINTFRSLSPLFRPHDIYVAGNTRLPGHPACKQSPLEAKRSNLRYLRKAIIVHSQGNRWSLRMQTVSKMIRVTRVIDARERQRHKKDRLLTLTSISFSRQANWVRLERLPPGLPATLPLELPIGTVPLLPPVEGGWGSGGPLAGSNPWLRWSLPPCLTGWPG